MDIQDTVGDITMDTQAGNYSVPMGVQDTSGDITMDTQAGNYSVAMGVQDTSGDITMDTWGVTKLCCHGYTRYIR